VRTSGKQFGAFLTIFTLHFSRVIALQFLVQRSEKWVGKNMKGRFLLIY